MEVLGVPGRPFLLNAAITLLLTVAIFYPALASFGQVLLGAEDIRLFLWLFWHFSNSLNNGTNPFYAGEIFHPYGISLSMTTLSPLQAIAYWLLPASFGPFGKITLLQALSFVLGGIFAFCLAYRFAKSFLPSFLGSALFNFSVYHSEKALHHLNYSMAFPFLALFFLCYFAAAERRKHGILLLSASLLLLALNEMTVAVMAGFVVFLDVFRHYLARSRVKLLTTRNAAILGGAVVLSMAANEALATLAAPQLLLYTLPPLPFLAACLAVLGPANAVAAEKAEGRLRSLVLASLPVAAYTVLLALQPSYAISHDNAISNSLFYAVPVEYLVIPSDFQAVAHAGVFSGLQAGSEAGVYAAAGLLLLVLSLVIPGASRDEEYFRNLSLLCLLFSFPIISEGGLTLLTVLPQPLFPLLGVLRVPVRFMVFSLLFLSLASALLAVRLLSFRHGRALVAGLSVLVLAVQWPAMGGFTFDGSVPAFYSGLAGTTGLTGMTGMTGMTGIEKKVFLYPDMDYYSLLNEVYYQTVHGNSLSAGIVSRQPLSGNPLYSLYSSPNVSRSDALAVAKSLGYDYVVFHKTACSNSSGCFRGIFVQDQALMDALAREKPPGAKVYEDDSIVVYACCS